MTDTIKRYPRRWQDQLVRAGVGGLPERVADRYRMERATVLEMLPRITPRRESYIGRDGRRRCWRECENCEGRGLDPYGYALRRRLMEGGADVARDMDPTCDDCDGRGGSWYRVKLLT